jgi:acetoacetyl-CoA synthetase
MTSNGGILWEADIHRKKSSSMSEFMSWLGARGIRTCSTWEDLYSWSISDLDGFWRALATFTGVVFDSHANQAYKEPPQKKMLGATWFPGATLNFARNLLLADDALPAIISYVESGVGLSRSELSFAELRRDVAKCAAGLKKFGVKKGDRVAGVLSNTKEAIIAMLATTSMGAIWSSCSPDFGVEGVFDRLSQIEPKVVFYTSAYRYNGKLFNCEPNASAFLARLKSLQGAVSVRHLDDSSPLPKKDGYVSYTWSDFLALAPSKVIEFTSVPFDHPVFIMFSSGTTGVPKCIVHGTGGTLLQHKKELMLHSDLKHGDRLLYFTTCGWMMWNWMASALSLGTSLVLFEGSLSFPDLSILWQVVGTEKVTALGTSPKFISACMNAGTEPKKHLQGHLPRTVLSTGSPLLPEHYTWIYDHVGQDLHLASISGGTDIISCFMLGNPILPVRAGEIQAPGLGMAIDVWDDSCRSLMQEKGELVCTKPFVSMPVGFLNDQGGKKYHEAYFDFFPEHDAEVWRHGDYVEWTAHGGIVVYGRSDATLNPGGVRIGTAEIYRQVENLTEIADSIAVGRQVDGDTEVVLFVKMSDGFPWDDELVAKLKAMIKSNLTPRHVPKEIIPVKDIPYTRSGKKIELAVTKVIHGEEVKNFGAFSNPESIAEYVTIARSRWGIS